jgi:hypothetical protein
MNSGQNPTPNLGRIVRSYTKKAPLDPNLAIPAPPPNHDLYRSEPSSWTPASSTFVSPDPDFSHVQHCLRVTPRTADEILECKFTAMDELLQNYSIPSGISFPSCFTIVPMENPILVAPPMPLLLHNSFVGGLISKCQKSCRLSTIIALALLPKIRAAYLSRR